MTKVAVVVVTHGDAGGLLARCLRAVRAEAPDSDLVVVDNGSGAADTSGRIPEVTRSAGGRLLSVDNRGYGAAVNAGVAHVDTSVAGGEATADAVDVVVLLNDDVVVEPGCVRRLAVALDAEGVGAAQPMLVTLDVEPSEVNSLGVAIDRFGAGSDIGAGEDPDLVPIEVGDLDVFTGGAVAFRAGYLADLGGFDERFFLYYEDVDLARRGSERGWRYRVVPAARAGHARSASTASLGDRRRQLIERNRLWCVARHGTRREVARAVGLSVRRLRHAPRRVHARALVAGLGGVPSRRSERRRAARTQTGVRA
ncbi:MAG: glycosyltransferase [Actinomycetota bacterium]